MIFPPIIPPTTQLPSEYFDTGTFDLLESLAQSIDPEYGDYTPDDPPSDGELIAGELAGNLLYVGIPAFVKTLIQYMGEINRLLADEQLVEVIMAGLRYGVAQEDPGCCVYLGGEYYQGARFVAQDYTEAVRLYEIAAKYGSLQAITALGYVYEYGRIGEPDYAKAYELFARAAGQGYPEAIYKLGDLYLRGEGVEADPLTAFRMYESCYEMSSQGVFADTRPTAQSAFRIAEMIVAGKYENYGVPRNTVRALKLYQEAELEVRFEVSQGNREYLDRLEAIVAGQETARNILDLYPEYYATDWVD
ncbi:MAG: hypothetical protein SPI77_01015 [Corynebacterium sp.]|nr:hypothetical protein [Corynebacterium sp.]